MFKVRRERWLAQLALKYAPSSVVLLISGFENGRVVFRPSSSCWYLTGVTEPGVVVAVGMEGVMTAYLPDYRMDRGCWTGGLTMGSDWWGNAGFSHVKSLGDAVPGYSLPVAPVDGCMRALAADLRRVVEKGGKVLMVLAEDEQRLLRWGLEREWGWLREAVMDVTGELAQLRRVKDEGEVKLIREAVQISTVAYEEVAGSICGEETEEGLRGRFEAVFVREGATRPAFPTIVAAGRNGTVLHYMPSRQQLGALGVQGRSPCDNGSRALALVDMGAEYGMYASDLTRVFPVGDRFSKRQQELYEIVLGVQQEVEACAKPGWFLKNEGRPELSLHHRAVGAFKELRLAQFFVHGIGHSVGLDVHDIDEVRLPLEPGMVFTIEPGLYLPDEGIGIRIEDDYLVTNSGVERLSSCLPRSVEAIEGMKR